MKREVYEWRLGPQWSQVFAVLLAVPAPVRFS